MKVLNPFAKDEMNYDHLATIMYSDGDILHFDYAICPSYNVLHGTTEGLLIFHPLTYSFFRSSADLQAMSNAFME